MKSIFSKPYTYPTILLLTTLIVYTFSYKGEGAHWNYFIYLADAFLHGRLDILYHPGWLNELVLWHGKYFVVYPPIPAVLLMPFVFLFGTNFPQPLLSIVLASINISLAYLFLTKFFSQRISIWVSLLYAFGTIQWYHAEVGSAWYLAHIVALFFIWLMLYEIANKKRMILIGVLIGCAYLARLPAILSIAFPLIYLSDHFINIQKEHKTIYPKNFKLLFLGIASFILLNFLYNYLRFGTIFDIAYSLLPIFNEPWYRYGLFSIRNISLHLQEIFFAMPKFINKPPFIIPSLNVMALWFVTPAFLTIPLADFKNKLVYSSLITVLIMSLPGLTHGSNGFTQFGYRFALDFLPFLLVLVASSLSRHFKWWMKFFIILSILINLWGVVMVSFLKIWSF